MTPKDADVIVLTYNRKELLLQLLARLAKQRSVNFNLIVTDDGSAQTIDPAAFPLITRYLWARNDGYHRVARLNEAMAMCPSPCIILLDDDCLPGSPRFIDGHLATLKEHPISRGVLKFPNVPDAGEWFSTANLGIRADVIRSVGYFDPAYDGAYGFEDMDLGNALEKAGYRAGRAVKATLAWHVGDFYAGGDRSDAVTGRNRRYFMKKWGYDPMPPPPA